MDSSINSLFVAIEDYDIDEVRSLILSGVDLNARNKDEETPLSIACEHNDLEMVHLLLQNGADTDIVGACDLTPVELSIMSGYLELAAYLIESGCAVSTEHNESTLMHAAAVVGSVEIGVELQKRGVPVDAADDSGRTPLHCAAQEGKLAFCKWLIDNNARVNIEDASGFTPLVQAVGEGSEEIVRLLIDCGADVNHVSTVGTALMNAVAWNKLTIIEMLERAGAEFEVKDSAGHYPIWYAVDYGYGEIIERYAGRYAGLLSDRELKNLQRLARIRRVSENLVSHLRDLTS